MADSRQVQVNLETLLGAAVRDLTLEVAANLTQDAPVDTGHFRRNFVPTIGTPFDGEDSGESQAIGQAALLSYQIGDGDTYVTNNVPYGAFLILGSSSQAPAGWDLQAVDRAVATVQERYGVRLDVTSSADVAARGARAAEGLAAAFSPFGGDE